MRSNPRKLEIFRVHDQILVLFVLDDLSEGGIDLLLRRPHRVPVADISSRVADEKGRSLPTSGSRKDYGPAPPIFL